MLGQYWTSWQVNCLALGVRDSIHARIIAWFWFALLLAQERGEPSKDAFSLLCRLSLWSYHFLAPLFLIGLDDYQDALIGFSRKRSKLSNRPTSFQNSGWLMFKSARGRKSGNRSWMVWTSTARTSSAPCSNRSSGASKT